MSTRLERHIWEWKGMGGIVWRRRKMVKYQTYEHVDVDHLFEKLHLWKLKKLFNKNITPVMIRDEVNFGGSKQMLSKSWFQQTLLILAHDVERVHLLSFDDKWQQLRLHAIVHFFCVWLFSAKEQSFRLDTCFGAMLLNQSRFQVLFFFLVPFCKFAWSGLPNDLHCLRQLDRNVVGLWTQKQISVYFNQPSATKLPSTNK